ncbi:MAG: ABC transporter permease [Gemmatimonadota bacterium]
MSLLRFAWRSMSSRPGFTAIVVTCMALGLAVNATVFAVFDTILWRQFDLREPQRLVTLRMELRRGDGEAGLAMSTLRDVQAGARSFDGIAGIVERSLTITDGEEPERVEGVSSSWNLFQLIGKSPALGRGFRADEDAGSAPTVAILSDALWQRRYAGDSSIIGRAIQINGSPHTVIGVMPPRFQFPETAQLWVPIGDFGRNDARNQRYVWAFARLRDGVDVGAARREYSALLERIESQAGLASERWTGRIELLREAFIPDDVRLIALTMMGAVTFVLLIACANVANLMLARMSSRQREIAVRTALGAGRGMIVRQLVLEATILALMAAVVSIPLVRLGLYLIDSAIPPGDHIPYYINWRIDARVVTYTAAAALAAGVLFGLVPALQATSGSLHASLKEGGRGSGQSRTKNRTRSILVVTEVALALVLLVGASLFVRSFAALAGAGVGFDTAPLLTLRTFLPGVPYDSAAARRLRVEDLVRRVESIPGVEAVGASNLIPLDGGGIWSRVQVPGREFREEDAPLVWWSGVTVGWSKALGLEIVAGRDLTAIEAGGEAPVTVIDEKLAQFLWPGENALGRTFRAGPDSTLPWFTVVGVARPWRQSQLGDVDEDPASAYMPLAWAVPRNVGIIVRVSGDPVSLVNAVRSQIRSADPLIPVFDVLPMDEVRAIGYWQYKLFGWMFGVFGGVALVLAAIGVYGVISYGVTQRTQEFGVRIALGAQRRRVLGLVIKGALRLATIGIVIGLVVALGVTRLVESILIVSPGDPASFVGVTIFLSLVALAAGYFPARKATAVDPIVALRAE